MDNLISEWIDLYNNNVSCTKIAKLYNTSVYKVIKALKETGLSIENKQNKISDNIPKIIKDYTSGQYSVNELAKKYKMSSTSILKWLHKNNIAVINNQNRTKFNEHVFDVIDSEEKAYWLGFIFADGYISNRDNGFELALSINDKSHLDKFNKFMEHEKDNVKTDSYRCRWSVVNKHLWDTLNNYGCTPRKSLTLEFPNINIFKDKSLIRHFIRGYWDGDGSIFFYDRGVRVSVLGTKNFLDNINSFLLNDFGKLSAKNNSNFTFTFSRNGSKAVAISYILYSHSNIYLDRKYQTFLQFKNCRFNAKALKLLEGKIGEDWDVNPELIADIKELRQCNA